MYIHLSNQLIKEKTMNPKEIKDLRDKLKLTQPELAYKLQIAPMTVSRWERGISAPSKVFITAMKRMG